MGAAFTCTQRLITEATGFSVTYSLSSILIISLTPPGHHKSACHHKPALISEFLLENKMQCFFLERTSKHLMQRLKLNRAKGQFI